MKELGCTLVFADSPEKLHCLRTQLPNFHEHVEVVAARWTQFLAPCVVT
jgi:hypothetical protein